MKTTTAMKTTNAMPSYLHAPGDLPVLELMDLAERLIAAGGWVEIHFQFTCQWCGQRNTFARPATVYEFGDCLVCGQETEILCGGWSLLRPAKSRREKVKR